jgi:threonine efflux protein
MPTCLPQNIGQRPLEIHAPLSLDYPLLGTFALLWLAIVPTAGPNSLLIVHLALTASWREVTGALAGNLIGIAIYALATLLGLALLLAVAPSLRVLLYLAGGAYLAWVGGRLLRSGMTRRRSAMQASPPSSHAVSNATRSSFAQGILTALANVQALFFLTSIFAGVGLLAANLPTQMAAVGIIVAVNGTYLALLAWLMQLPGPRTFYARHRWLMEMGFGVLFLAFGARLVQRELAAWV